MMLRAERRDHHLDELIIAGRLEAVFGEVFVVVTVIDRPGMQRFAPRGVILGGQHGQNGGIQSARQEAGKRDIGHQLPLCRVADQFVRALDGLLKGVGVLPCFQLPIGMVGVALGGKHRVMSGQQRVDLPEHAGRGRTRGAEQ